MCLIIQISFENSTKQHQKLQPKYQGQAYDFLHIDSLLFLQQKKRAQSQVFHFINKFQNTSLNFIIIMSMKVSKKEKIPTFIKKLVQILQDDKFSEMISWLPNGNGFQILNVIQFTQKVLPFYFKHSNTSSFIRQLNMYGFTRPKQSTQNVYIHPSFQKENLNSLKLIKRKQRRARNNSIDSQSQLQPFVESCNSEFMKQFERVSIQNKMLKNQNEELLLKLNSYKGIKQKLKRTTKELNKYINNNSQNQRQEKGTTTSTCSNNSSESSFRLNSSCFKTLHPELNPWQQLSYQILLQGSKVN